MMPKAPTVESRGFLGRKGFVWEFIGSWFVPVIMSGAYIVLALTSETDATGWAWMSIGLAFVLVLWWLFRMLTRNAAIARALNTGDANALTQIDKTPMGFAIAHEMRADWDKALRQLDRVSPEKPKDQILVDTVKISAYVELGDVAKARAVLNSMPVDKLNPRLDAQLALQAELARGKVLGAEHDHEQALVVLDKVIADVRTGQWSRAMANHYAGLAARGAGQADRADLYRAAAAKLAPAAWFNG
ncbi:MAG: hypothetical protein QM831_30575 [Kofleriaceae bacterium]